MKPKTLLRIKERKSDGQSICRWCSADKNHQVSATETLGARNIWLNGQTPFQNNSAIPGLSGSIEFESALKNMSGWFDGAGVSTEDTFHIRGSAPPPSEEDLQSIGRYYTAQMKSAQSSQHRCMEPRTADPYKLKAL